MEVAGMMYGVSMSKDGTSKVIAQRLEPPAQQASLDVEPVAAAVEDDDYDDIVGVPEPDVVG
jgi:hypothetical protein